MKNTSTIPEAVSMIKYRLILSLVVTTLISLLASCQLLNPKTEEAKKATIHLTVLNPSSIPVDSLFLYWGNTQSPSPDGSTSVSPASFPYTTTLSNLTPAAAFAVGVSGLDSSESEVASGAQFLDTSSGGSFNVTITVAEAVTQPDEGNEAFADWSAVTTLAGGSTMETAVGIPADSAWYSSNIAEDGGETWYRVSTTAGTQHSFFWDDDDEGSQTYSGDVKLYFYDSEGGALDSEAGYDSAYNLPVSITATGSEIFIKVVAAYDSGSFAFGFETATAEAESEARVHVTIYNVDDREGDSLRLYSGDMGGDGGLSEYISLPIEYPAEYTIETTDLISEFTVLASLHDDGTPVAMGNKTIDISAGGDYYVSIDMALFEMPTSLSALHASVPAFQSWSESTVPNSVKARTWLKALRHQR